MAGTNDKNTIMEHSKETIAMLIDADNSPSDKIDYIRAEMAKYGVVKIRRAYGTGKAGRSKDGRTSFTTTLSVRSSSSITPRARTPRTWP